MKRFSSFLSLVPVGCASIGLSLAFPFVFCVMVLANKFLLFFLSPLLHQQVLQQLACDVFCLFMHEPRFFPCFFFFLYVSYNFQQHGVYVDPIITSFVSVELLFLSK
jgi:hypothetical protein